MIKYFLKKKFLDVKKPYLNPLPPPPSLSPGLHTSSLLCSATQQIREKKIGSKVKLSRQKKMPLGERGPGDRSESRYCGVETEFSDDVPGLLSFNLTSGGFDFVVATLVRPLLSFPLFSIPLVIFGAFNLCIFRLQLPGFELSPSVHLVRVIGREKCK